MRISISLRLSEIKGLPVRTPPAGAGRKIGAIVQRFKRVREVSRATMRPAFSGWRSDGVRRRSNRPFEVSRKRASLQKGMFS